MNSVLLSRPVSGNLPRHLCASAARTALPLLCSTLAIAQTEPATDPKPADSSATLERVEITGRRSEASRRQSTTAKTVIGRNELDRFGDTNVGDTLKRLPGVTVDGAPGRGGEIRMRGLGSGYTQILINGERIPAGLSLETLSPDQIERIEIVRAPTAEYGTQAIAGTINIVLKQDGRRRQESLTTAWTMDGSRPQPSVNWTRTGSDDERSYDMAASVFRNTRQDLSTTHTVSSATASRPAQDKVEYGGGRLRREGFSANGRVQWKLDGGQSFALIPNVFYTQGRYAYHGEVSPTTAQPYSAVDSPSNWYYGIAGSTAHWQLRPGDEGKLDVKLGGHASTWGNNVWRYEDRTDGPTAAPTYDRTYTNSPRTTENGMRSSGKYNRLLDNDHQLTAGWEVDMAWRRETQQPTDTLGSAADEDVSARRLVSALWAQDEWNLTAQWAVHAGLRWESIRTLSSDAGQRLSNHSSVASPLLHAMWRPDPNSRNQWRASLTRSYKAPTTQQLMARRAVNSATPSNTENTPDTADRLGNPNLRPELATGLDLAYELYPTSGGAVSVGLFHRYIKDMIRTVTTSSAESVAWATAPRYYSQPVNVSSATSSGIELEAKGRLSDWWRSWWAGAPALDVRGNVSFFRSRVAGVPGPDNTLDRQPNWSGNLGADYKLPGQPFTIGGNLNYTPGYQTQQSAELRSFTAQRRVLDAYGTWAINPQTLLRLSASNLWPQRSVSGSQFVSSSYTETATRSSVTTTLWSVRLERKL